MDYYLDKVQDIYQGIAENLSFGNLFMVFSWILVVALFLYLPVIIKRKQRALSALIIFIDLFVFGFYGIGFKRELKSFDTLKPQYSTIYEEIRKDKDIYRILPYDIHSEDLPNWSIPNANILYALDSVGYYTPLAIKRYRSALSGLEVVDDSLGVRQADEEALRNNIYALRLLNVKYIISGKELEDGFLELKKKEAGVFLYELGGCYPRIFFTVDIDKKIRPSLVDDIQLASYSNGHADIHINTAKEGYVVFSEAYYPGWKAFVDGKKMDIVKVNDLVQAVKVDAGEHYIEFRYNPSP
jgi:hypothetical protein